MNPPSEGIRLDSNIPAMRPQLPIAQRVLPYLQRIDSNRIYSNWGPLVTELSSRLCTLFALPDEAAPVTCTNSGMSALVGAILGTTGMASPAKPVAIVPNFTFTATGLAVRMCGYDVVLADCRANSWAVHPEDLLAQPGLLERTGLVVPVAPFGKSVDQTVWLRFREQTGIPVVIDGAACFDAFLMPGHTGAGPLPVALSFHATKSFSTGEGGAVVCTDTALTNKIWQCLNFGFRNSRNSTLCGINGKMSEYAAAVGLAELDGWVDKQKGFLDAFRCYRETLTRLGVDAKLWGPPEVSACYVLLQCTSEMQAEDIMRTLEHDNIDSRLWYGAGLAAHDIFKDAQRIALANPAGLNPQTLVGLPVAPDLSSAQVQRVCNAIRRALQG